jgi:hypothetical protein
VYRDDCVCKWYAYRFKSKLSLDEILERLNQLTPGAWHERWKDAWGEYLFGRISPAPYNAVVKLIAEDTYYVVNVKLRAEKPGGEAEFQAAHDRIFDELLPALGARGLKPVDYYE